VLKCSGGNVARPPSNFGGGERIDYAYLSRSELLGAVSVRRHVVGKASS